MNTDINLELFETLPVCFGVTGCILTFWGLRIR
ncbi:hypothetical protein T02_9528 [Trichinella nativa]|uniref:Uncharacterized protein n=1 Tax=Trichinella nativa TaxID=6335 RepID=A0A0V1KJH5_9BILA|nr:hypothetical protein T02_9528 [Trichinella nativa]